MKSGMADRKRMKSSCGVKLNKLRPTMKNTKAERDGIL